MRNLESGPSPEEISRDEFNAPEAEKREETFEDVALIAQQQGENIERGAQEKGYSGILSNLSKPGRKFAGVVLLTLSSFAAGCRSRGQPGKAGLIEKKSAASARDLEAEAVKESEAVSKKIKEAELEQEQTEKKYKDKLKAVEEEKRKGDMLMEEKERREREQSKRREKTGQEQKKEKADILQAFHHFFGRSIVVDMNDGSFAIDLINENTANASEGCFKIKPENLLQLQAAQKDYADGLKNIQRRYKIPKVAEEKAEKLKRIARGQMIRIIENECEAMQDSDVPPQIKKVQQERQEKLERELERRDKKLYE